MSEVQTPPEALEEKAPEIECPPPEDLPDSDGEPLETTWHFTAIALLIDLVHSWMRGRTDYFVGGNLFLYYSWQKSKKQDYKGPDFMFVKDVDRAKVRDYWAVWEEGGKYPNVIIELLSKETARTDRTTKKRLYEQVFRTPEYFWYDPATQEFKGWRLSGEMEYQPITPNERGWLWSQQLGLWLGPWQGEHFGIQATWLRFYDPQGQLVLLQKEAAQTELARLKALLAEKGIDVPPGGEASR